MPQDQKRPIMPGGAIVSTAGLRRRRGWPLVNSVAVGSCDAFLRRAQCMVANFGAGFGTSAGCDHHAILHRNERLQLQGVEGQLLPGEDARQGDAELLCPAVLHRRDQQHVLSHAVSQRARVVGHAGAGKLSVCPQGAPGDHALQAAQGRPRPDGAIPAGGVRAQAAVGTAALSATAEFQERPGEARRILGF